MQGFCLRQTELQSVTEFVRFRVNRFHRYKIPPFKICPALETGSHDAEKKKTLTKAEYRVENFLAKFLREFVFADWRFFCLLRELIFVIRTNWFFLLGINICDSQKVPGTQH